MSIKFKIIKPSLNIFLARFLDSFLKRRNFAQPFQTAAFNLDFKNY
jgi:hypothetical protein